jgi:hypothetical protein
MWRGKGQAPQFNSMLICERRHDLAGEAPQLVLAAQQRRMMYLTPVACSLAEFRRSRGVP